MRNQRPEVIAAKREGQRRISKTKKGKEAARISTIKYRSKPEAREKIKARNAAWYMQPHIRERMLKKHQTPEAREAARIRTAKYLKEHPEIARTNNAKRRAQRVAATIGRTDLILKWETSWRKKRTVICYWCSTDVSPKRCHSDHVTPLSKGGIHAVENLCISCAVCNMRKHDKMLPEWNSKLAQPVLL